MTPMNLLKLIHYTTRHEKFSYVLFIQAIIAGLGSSIIIITTGNKESMAEWIISHYLAKR